MGLLETTDGQAESRPRTLSFASSNNQTVSRAFKHAGVKIAGVIFLLATLAILISIDNANGKATGSKLDTAASGNANLTLDTAAASTPSADSVQPSSSSTSVSTNSSSSNSDHSSVNVSVNGQDVPVPQNGNVSKTIVTDDGTTSLNINSSNQGDANNNSSSFTSLNVSSNSASFDNSFSSGSAY